MSMNCPYCHQWLTEDEQQAGECAACQMDDVIAKPIAIKEGEHAAENQPLAA